VIKKKILKALEMAAELAVGTLRMEVFDTDIDTP
jgi:hypothetical protein